MKTTWSILFLGFSFSVCAMPNPENGNPQQQPTQQNSSPPQQQPSQQNPPQQLHPSLIPPQQQPQPQNQPQQQPSQIPPQQQSLQIPPQQQPSQQQPLPIPPQQQPPQISHQQQQQPINDDHPPHPVHPDHPPHAEHPPHPDHPPHPENPNEQPKSQAPPPLQQRPQPLGSQSQQQPQLQQQLQSIGSKQQPQLQQQLQSLGLSQSQQRPLTALPQQQSHSDSRTAPQGNANGKTNERETSSPGSSSGFAANHNDQSAQLGDFPYQVQIRVRGKFKGGGTLVRSPITGNQIVLTAAHIVAETEYNSSQPVIPEQITIRMGIVYREDIGQERHVIRNFVHPGYILWKEKQRPIFNDIAILVPDRPFIYNDHVQTLALPILDWPPAHETVIVKGWGQGREEGHTGASSILRFFKVPVWENFKCDAVYYKESGLDLVTSRHFCAGFEDGRKDSCGGDSGSAAMATVNGVPYMAGVVSWGKGCGEPGYPGVYTKVSAHMHWIKETMYLFETFGYI